MQWQVTYKGFLQTVTRSFESREAAETWLRQTGRRDLIPQLKEQPATDKMIDALRFYADPENWKDVETGIGMYPGDAVDYGARAREALGD